MLTGVTLVEEFPFYSQYDTAAEADKTKFLLGPIDVQIRSRINDDTNEWLQTDAGMKLTTKGMARNLELIRFGLKGVENFKDKTGNDIKITFVNRIVGGIPYQVVSETFLNTIPMLVIRELADKIYELNTAGDDLVKK